MLEITHGWIAGVFLILAGVYQFTPLKDACLGTCRAPLGFFITHWQPGPAGAFYMGLRHGLYCIGCCWAMMAILFVFGVMSLLAIVAVSTAVAIEKLLPRGHQSARFLGIGLVAWGTFILVS
jgi:predicted metal-binding membrane protein